MKNFKSPYEIVKRRYITEKSSVLENLKDAKSNMSIARYVLPKYVFVVDINANKLEIAQAIEEIYREQGVTVQAVNTILVKPKRFNRKGRQNEGRSRYLKKAIVTFKTGDLS